MGKATQDLRNEHDAILHVLHIVDHVLASPLDREEERPFACELLDFLTIFADKCHHGKEEFILFPRMEQAGVPRKNGPIGAMLIEHDQARDLIKCLKVTVEEVDMEKFEKVLVAYSQLLRAHIEKENNILFPMADHLLDDAEQEKLFERFEEHEENVVGHGVHEKLHANIHNWEKQFGYKPV